MIVKVYMTAFKDKDSVREVDVPDLEIDGKSVEEILQRVFYWGQNIFQQRNQPSVSVGDVIELNGKYHQVAVAGFKELTKEEFEAIEEKQCLSFLEG